MKRLASSIAGGLALGACVHPMSTAPSLDGSHWQVLKINGQDVPQTPQYQVEFRDGRLGGKLGCNSFTGPYTLSADTLTVGPAAATKMACAGRGMADEQAGFATIGQPLQMAWAESGARLVLTSSAGSLELRRMR